MGLDVYVGTLTRYYSGEWETVIQRYSREQGIPLRVVRQPSEPDEAIRDQAQILPIVEAWLAGLARSLQESFDLAQVDWSEQATRPYFTDKPAFDCFGALVILAAKSESGVPLPDFQPADWARDPDLEALRRASTPLIYGQLYWPEVWLPIDVPATFRAPLPNGHEKDIGSSPRLLAQLQALNSKTYDGNRDSIKEWRREMPDGADPDFHKHAKAGLSIMLTLAKHAVRERLPMLLDY